MAVDLHGTGVEVKLMLPGPIDTEIWDQPDNDPRRFNGPFVPAVECAAAIVAGMEDDGFEYYVPAEVPRRLRHAARHGREQDDRHRRVRRDDGRARPVARDADRWIRGSSPAGGVTSRSRIRWCADQGEMLMSEPPAILRYGEREFELPAVVGTEGERGARHLEAPCRDRLRHPRQRLREHRVVRVGDHVHRRRGRHPPVPRHRHRGARLRAGPVVPRDVVPARSTASCPPRPSATSSAHGIRKHTLVHEDVKRFFDGFPKDAHPMATLSSAVTRAVDLLPGQPRPQGPRSRRSCRSSG